MSTTTEWRKSRLDELCEINPLKPKLTGVDDSTEVLFVPMASVDDVSGEILSPQQSTIGAVGRKSYRSFTSGDVLFAKITPCMENGKSTIVPEIPTGFGFGSTEFHVLRPKAGIDARLIWHLIRQRSFRDEAASHFAGSVGQLRVPPDFLRTYETFIPTQSEDQRRLADILDFATSKTSSAESHLKNASRSIERFRQSVLAAACSGRLTADWRESRGISEWQLRRAEDVCAKVQSGSTPKVWHAKDGGIPFLKVYNIVDQRLDFDYRPQFISEELFHGAFRRTEALPGDVLMNIVGPPLGKVAIVTDQYPAWSINQAITLFRPSDQISTEWLYIFLCSGISVTEIMNDTKGSVGQVNISLSQCRDFMIPIPTMEEQLEISRRVNELLKVTHTVSQRIGGASDQISRMSQAVLARAFRGELQLNGDTV